MKKGRGEKTSAWGQVVSNLFFLLAAFGMLFLGIHAAEKTISFARAEKIEIINNLVEGLSESSKIKDQGKKLQGIIYNYVESFIKAVAGFEFVPRNDFSVLPRIINALPEETEIISFVYNGRNLTICTEQSDPAAVLEMTHNLKKRLEEFEDIVYSYYIDADGRCIAQITLISHHYDESDLGRELEKNFFPPKNTKKEEE